MMPLGPEATALGWPVFPCAADKRPLTANGFKDATTDPAQIDRLFRDAHAIGVPTGRSTFVAVDLDVKREPSGLAWLEQNRHRLPRTRTIRTGSGGMHLYFQHPAGDIELRNSNGKLAPNVDTRGVGGYVVAPPSPGYTVADDAPIAAMPDWLVAAWTYRPPQPPPAPPPRPRQHDSAAGSPYGLAALDAECTAVMQAPFGQQETTLNAAALKIGALVAGNELSAGYARSALLAAGHAMPNESGREPWSHADVEAKVTRGMADGSARPRQAPERPQRQHSAPPPPDDVPPAEDREEPEPDEPNSTEQTEQPERETVDTGLPIVWFHEVAPDLSARDFVEGVLTDESMSVVYGESNVGKTFFASDLGMHVALGRTWMGRAVDARGTLYLAMEGGHGIKNRVAAFKLHHGLDGEIIPFAIIPMGLNLLDPLADTQRVIDAIKAAEKVCGFKFGLVIGDTLSRAMAGGNENASEDMGALVTNSDAIRAECKAHFMWIHHSGKDQARGARGHSLLRAATDTEIEVTREDGMPPIARTKKQRDLPNDGEFPFVLKVIELGTNRRNKPVTSCVVTCPDTDEPARRPRSLKPSAKAALQCLIEAGAEFSAPLPPSWGMAAHLRGVKEDDWRERFFSTGMPGAAYDTKRMAWNRGIKDLREMGIVAARNGLAWLTDQSTGE